MGVFHPNPSWGKPLRISGATLSGPEYRIAGMGSSMAPVFGARRHLMRWLCGSSPAFPGSERAATRRFEPFRANGFRRAPPPPRRRFAPGGKRKPPPGRRTQFASRRTLEGSSSWGRPKFITTASNVLSEKGSEWASPCRSSSPGRRRLAFAMASPKARPPSSPPPTRRGARCRTESWRCLPPNSPRSRARKRDWDKRTRP
jgi:hypothetical protein